MSTLNQAILCGYVGKDPKEINFDNGQKIVIVALATYDFWEDEEGVRHAVTDWHKIVFKNEKADLALEKIKKSSFIYLEGKIKNRSYNDKEGLNHLMTEIVVTRFRMLQSPLVENPEDPATENVVDEIKFADKDDDPQND